MTDVPRPADAASASSQGPDREALARRILIALTNVPDECAHERHGIPGCVHCDVDAVLALLPTPSAPGDEPVFARMPTSVRRYVMRPMTEAEEATEDASGPWEYPPAPGDVTEADYRGAEDPFADPPAPGDPNDPDPEPYTGWQLLHDGYGNLAAVPPAPGGGEGLRAAAEKRLLHGHNDTCDMAMDKAAGPSFQGYACTCGHDDLTAALAARDTDQGAGDALAEAAKHMLRTVEGRAWRMTPYDSDTETRCSSLVGPDEPCGECIPCWTYNVTKAAAALRAALARATPEEDR
jgi:hypothetical protein